jgi:hypothetical protein
MDSPGPEKVPAFSMPAGRTGALYKGVLKRQWSSFRKCGIV